MRRSYLKLPEAAATSTKKTQFKSKAAELKAKEDRLKDALDNERRYRIRLQVAYEELLTKVRRLAKADPDLANYLNRHVVGYSFKRLSVANGGDSES